MQIINASIFNFFAKLESQSIIELLDAASKGDDKVRMIAHHSSDVWTSGRHV